MLIVSESGYKSQEEDSVNNKLSEIILSTTNMSHGRGIFCTSNLQQFYIDLGIKNFKSNIY